MKKLISFILIAVTSLSGFAQEKHYNHKPQHQHSQRQHYAPQQQYYAPVIPDNRREWAAFLLGGALLAPRVEYRNEYYPARPMPREWYCQYVEQYDLYQERYVVRYVCH